MSISSEITRLQGAKADIKTAIEAKGVTVPANALLDSFDTYIAQISGGGSTGLEYEEGTYTPTQDISRPTINFSNSHNKSPSIIVFHDNTNTYDATSNTNYLFAFIDWYRMWNGVADFYSSTVKHYALYVAKYRTSSSFDYTRGSCTTSSDDTVNTSNANSCYWANKTSFFPSSNSSRYWRAGRTYKWIAIWK